MSALIAYSSHSLWQQTFKDLLAACDRRSFVFSNLLELKDFLHQVDHKVIAIEEGSSTVDVSLINEFCALEATKVVLITDKSEGLRDLDTRVSVVIKPVAHKQLAGLIESLLMELAPDGK